jgi:CheY-like chemotaxis protein
MSRPTAIVCDDDPSVRQVVSFLVQDCGYDVQAETDVVPELVAAARAGQPDLLILDLYLVGLSGLAALGELLEVAPTCKVVVYSAHDAWQQQAMAAGATAFVAKPDFHGLEAAVRALTPKRRRTAKAAAPH